MCEAALKKAEEAVVRSHAVEMETDKGYFFPVSLLFSLARCKSGGNEPSYFYFLFYFLLETLKNVSATFFNVLLIMS